LLKRNKKEKKEPREQMKKKKDLSGIVSDMNIVALVV